MIITVTPNPVLDRTLIVPAIMFAEEALYAQVRIELWEP